MSTGEKIKAHLNYVRAWYGRNNIIIFDYQRKCLVMLVLNIKTKHTDLLKSDNSISSQNRKV